MRRHVLTCVVGLLLGSVEAVSAQIGSPPYIFVDGTTAVAGEVNGNFATVYANALNRLGGTMQGSITFDPAGDHDITGLRHLGMSGNATIGGNVVATGTLSAGGAASFGTVTLSTLTCTGCVGPTQIASTSVTPASYGSTTTIPTFTVDADGRLTAAGTTATSALTGISESGITDGSILARVAGNETISGTWTFNNAITVAGVTCTGCVGATQIASTAVSPASYGSTTAIPTFTVDADGRLTAAGTVATSALTGIVETAITDGSVFPRLAANETITGAWTFSGGMAFTGSVSVPGANLSTGFSFSDTTLRLVGVEPGVYVRRGSTSIAYLGEDRWSPMSDGTRDLGGVGARFKNIHLALDGAASPNYVVVLDPADATQFAYIGGWTGTCSAASFTVQGGVITAC